MNDCRSWLPTAAAAAVDVAMTAALAAALRRSAQSSRFHLAHLFICRAPAPTTSTKPRSQNCYVSTRRRIRTWRAQVHPLLSTASAAVSVTCACTSIDERVCVFVPLLPSWAASEDGAMTTTARSMPSGPAVWHSRTELCGGCRCIHGLVGAVQGAGGGGPKRDFLSRGSEQAACPRLPVL